jgi:lipid A 3-O-deacylase
MPSGRRSSLFGRKNWEWLQLIMHLWIKNVLLGSLFTVAALAADEAERQPWQSSAWDVEAGMLWQFGVSTPFDYRMLQTQISWRSSEFVGHQFEDGSRLTVRHRITLIATAVQSGPESHYIAFAGSPSLEWWNRSGTWSVFTGAGGGFGLIDSRGVQGGQGQDFTLNWFARGGIEHVVSRHWRLSAAIMFQHLSNGGQTSPNPGIDVVGLMIGWSWSR